MAFRRPSPTQFFIAVILAVVMAMSGQRSFAAVPMPDLQQALTALAATTSDSEAEARAMSAAIAAARRHGTTKALPDAIDHAAQAEAMARDIKSPEDAAAAAHAYAEAARISPWVAEYQFARGELLIKAHVYDAALRAFKLYLEAAPAAGDRTEVQKLIAGLAHQPSVPATGNPTPTDGAGYLAGNAIRDCSMCPEMVVIPLGEFAMGSPANEAGRFDSEGPVHAVRIRSFALGKYDVTEKEFAEFIAKTGYQPGVCDSITHRAWRSAGEGRVFPPGMADLPLEPAVCLNWNDAQAYIKWLNEQVTEKGHALYRLPSEAEWEYAARAGTTTARWWGDAIGAGNANCHGCGSYWDNALVAPVGSFGPNGFGLYDMLGNVWQWVADCWNESYSGAPADGTVWQTGNCEKRVMRGGSWSNISVFIRSATRSGADAAGGDFDNASYVGFRLARNLP